MERLLILGVDTVAGINLADSLGSGFDVLGVCDNAPVHISRGRVESHHDDAAALAAIVRGWHPQWMIACGSYSQSAWDEPATPSAKEITLAGQLAALGRELSSQVTLISSDALFSGPRMFHDESSPPATASAVAKGLMGVEQAVAGPNTWIVRSHVYGWSGGLGTSFAERLYQAIADGCSIAADGQRHATPILATDLAPLLARGFEMRLAGLYHLSGAERTSPHRFACELAAACGARWNERPRASAAAETGLGETSLSSKRARRTLKMATPLLREGLTRFVAQSGARRPLAAHELAA